MPVRNEPAAGDRLSRLAGALQPYHLGLQAGPYGSVLIVRAAPTARPESTSAILTAAAVQPPELIVTTSRYEMMREPVMLAVTLANTDVERLPDLGDDPLRAVGRLPGTGVNGLSAKTNLRGGADDETLVTYGDLRLFNPFHLKDFQSIFSSIDPAVIAGLDVYTGAFPPAYGERLSGVIDIRPFEPPGEGYRALSLSLFNAAALITDGWSDGRGTWLLSARRGNLDYLLDLASQEVGEPRYSDIHGSLAWEFSDSFSASANALVFDDNVNVFDSDQEERATARYHDTYLWLRVDNRLSDALDGFSLLSYADLTQDRQGSAEQPEVSSGYLNEHRRAEVVGFLTQWSLGFENGNRIDFGGELRHSRARYSYADDVTFAILFDIDGAPTESTRVRDLQATPSGEYYAASINSKLALPLKLTGELGVRWDKSTLAGGSGNVGPRISLLRTLGERTHARLAWGRYWQSQSVGELQVNDGITGFAPAERADHLVLGVEQEFPALRLRVEAFRKDYRHRRDRFENLLNSFILLPELKPDRIRVAAGDGYARGIETTIRSPSAQRWNWWASYTWSQVRDEIDGSDVPRSWDQTHALSAGIVWSGDHWDLSAAALYRTGWPTTYFELEDPASDVVSTGPRNAERFGAYTSLDLRAARRFQTDAGLISVFVEVTNSLNRRNECCVEYGIENQDGTRVLQEERQYNLPILPSVGISWQF